MAAASEVLRLPRLREVTEVTQVHTALAVSEPTGLVTPGCAAKDFNLKMGKRVSLGHKVKFVSSATILPGKERLAELSACLCQVQSKFFFFQF